MAPKKNYVHIFLQNIAQAVGYKSKGSPIPPPQFPTRNRITHAQKLSTRFDDIWKSNDDLKSRRQAQSFKSRTGVYVEFLSSTDFDLLTKSLEDSRQGIIA